MQISKILASAAFLLLSSCGLIYLAPSIDNDAAQFDFRVIELDSQTVLNANSNDYSPRQLPLAFRQVAGGGSLRTGGTLPDPVLDEQQRPRQLETRLPPELPDRPYIIGIGDVLVLATVQAASSIEELSGLLAAQNRRQGYVVQDDGAIAIPDVGRVQMSGLNLAEAESAVFQALVENQLDPTFSIEVAEFNSKRVTIGGAVQRTAILPITLTPLTLKEAVAATGGVVSADLDFVAIRLYRSGTLYQVPLSELPDTEVLLQDGDSIFVDTDFELERAQAYFQQQITLAEQRLSARSQALSALQTEISLRRAALDEARGNFESRLGFDAVKIDYVYLTGEVVNQGRFALPFGRQASLADALFQEAAGPDSETGDPSKIYILRENEIGEVIAYNLNGLNPVNFVLATQLELRPNDIIFVGQQPVTKWNRVVQQIVPSLIIAGANAAN